MSGLPYWAAPGRSVIFHNVVRKIVRSYCIADRHGRHNSDELMLRLEGIDREINHTDEYRSIRQPLTEKLK